MGAVPISKGEEKASVSVPVSEPKNAAGAASMGASALCDLKHGFSASVAISQLAYMKARIGGEGEALSLHLKGLQMLQSVVERLDTFKTSDSGELQELRERVRDMFSSELATVRNLQVDLRMKPRGNVWEMIYEHALELGKHGAVDEMYANYSESSHWYSQALTLLYVLRESAVSASDRTLLDTLLQRCEARLAAVNLCKTAQ